MKNLSNKPLIWKSIKPEDNRALLRCNAVTDLSKLAKLPQEKFNDWLQTQPLELQAPLLKITEYAGSFIDENNTLGQLVEMARNDLRDIPRARGNRKYN